MSTTTENTNGALMQPPASDPAADIAANVNTAARTALRMGGARKRAGADPYDELLWRLQARQEGVAASTTLGLVGCEGRTGVTTVAANVAVRACELRLGTVLLVETNFEGPRLSDLWKLAPGPGLAELLAGGASYAECLRPGPTPGLEVMPAGARRRDEFPVWEPGSVDAFLAEASVDHNLVIFDLPPANRMQQALMLVKRLDQVLLVVRAESTRKDEAQRAADLLLADGVPLRGVVLNRQRSYVPKWLARWT